MKTIEEKAKAYDEIIERAKTMLSAGEVMYGKENNASQLITDIIPELRENEDERIRKAIIELLKEVGRDDTGISENAKCMIAWLEKQKEQKPILEVFGFKVGDAVRLKDGDGRKHIIKSFEEVEGVHGPNFYHVEFEDNSARDGIYPGEEYPNGYYTQMEKFEEEQEPINESNMHESTLDEARKWNEAYEKGYSLGYENGRNEQKSWEWGEEETKLLDSIIDDYEAAAKSFCGYDGKIGLLRAIRDGEYDLSKQEWSEEDMTKLRDVVRMIEDSGHVKSIREHYERFLNSLPERFNLQPKQEWSEEDEKMLKSITGDLFCGTDFNMELKFAASKKVNWLKDKLKSLRPNKQD